MISAPINLMFNLTSVGKPVVDQEKKSGKSTNLGLVLELAKPPFTKPPCGSSRLVGKCAGGPVGPKSIRDHPRMNKTWNSIV